MSRAAPVARAPKQERSRASFERVIEAATAILRERGHADFTLSEVSRRSKVSIGSIYCRVDGKDTLVHIVQERVYQQLEREFAEIVNRLRRQSLPLRKLVPPLVRDVAELYRRYGSVFNAMFALAIDDPVIAATGRQAYANSELDFKLLLLEHRDEITHPDPEHAAKFAFALVWDLVSRRLGFGNIGGMSAGDWRELLDDLAVAVLGVVLIDPADHRAATR
jgi:AcrR family transcriptional regulator